MPDNDFDQFRMAVRGNPAQPWWPASAWSSVTGSRVPDGPAVLSLGRVSTPFYAEIICSGEEVQKSGRNREGTARSGGLMLMHFETKLFQAGVGDCRELSVEKINPQQ